MIFLIRRNIWCIIGHYVEGRCIVNNFNSEYTVSRPLVLYWRETIDRISIEYNMQVGEQAKRANG